MVPRGRRLLRLAIPVAVVAVTVALAVMALRARWAHRAAAERVMRDYAGVAATEFVRRTAFDVGFNGYQAVAVALARTDAAGAIAVPPRVPAQARDLVRHLVVWERGGMRSSDGGAPPAWLEPWLRAEAEGSLRVDADDPFLVRHRVIDGRAETLVLVPLDAAGARLAAFDVRPAALAPFLRRSLERGPLLPVVVGDGSVANADLALSFRDAAGDEGLRTGGGPWPDGEVDVPFGDFYLSVLAGSHVRVSIDPAVAERLLPGGLPPSLVPWLAVLVVGALVLLALGVRQRRRERAFARLREDFVVGVSHELRTPLAQIRLNTETVLLGRCRSDDERRRFLEAAMRETVRLGHLVDNVLDFSRAQRGVLDVAATPHRLAPLVAEVTEAFRPLAAARRVRLAAELDADARAAVDEGGLTRVLLNLLDNAVKYGPEAGEVTIRLRRAADDVELSVEDRGPGVPAGEREAIFAPFQRLDRDRQSAGGGAGIGLAIVRDLVTRHGGSCRVEDREGGGARFVVRLPRAEAPT